MRLPRGVAFTGVAFTIAASLLTACGDAGRVDYSGPTAGWDVWGNEV